MIPIGLWLPEGIAIKNTGWATPVLVGVMMGISGFTLDTGKLQSQSTNLCAIGLVLVSTYCVAPLVAYGLAIGLQPEGNAHFLTAVMLLAAQASSSPLPGADRARPGQSGNRAHLLCCPVRHRRSDAVHSAAQRRGRGGTPGGQHDFKNAEGSHFTCRAWSGAASFLEKTQPFIKGIRLIPQIIILVFVYSGFSVATADSGQHGNRPPHRACLHPRTRSVGLEFWDEPALPAGQRHRHGLVFSGSQKRRNGIYLWERFFGDNPIGRCRSPSIT